MTVDVSARVRPSTVAIVGRPNVGKSALFNRLVGKRLAIVDDMPGVTRDRLYALADWQGRTFSLVDTAGIDIELGESDDIAKQTRMQAEIAARDADVVVLVVDAAAGLSPLDQEVVEIMRRKGRKALLCANKAESERARLQIAGEFSRLGLGEAIAVSALHGEGTGDLLDAIVERLPPAESEMPEETTELAIAFVGQPNVGKSSLVNALLGEERTIVSNVPGTTRDAIDEMFSYAGRPIRLIDTAGMRKRPQNHGSIEFYSSLRTLRAIARCDIAVLVIDSMKGITNQDRRMIGMIIEERKGCIIVANKWDLARELGDFQQNDLIEVIHEQVPFATFIPVTFLSALTGRKLGGLMPLVMRISDNLDRRIATSPLNTLIRDAVYAHPAPIKSDKVLRIYYGSQVASHPPLFVFSTNDPDLLTTAYRRFLERTIRSQHDFEGIPLTLEFRGRGGGENDA